VSKRCSKRTGCRSCRRRDLDCTQFLPVTVALAVALALVLTGSSNVPCRGVLSACVHVATLVSVALALAPAVQTSRCCQLIIADRTRDAEKVTGILDHVGVGHLRVRTVADGILSGVLVRLIVQLWLSPSRWRRAGSRATRIVERAIGCAVLVTVPLTVPTLVRVALAPGASGPNEPTLPILSSLTNRDIEKVAGILDT